MKNILICNSKGGVGKSLIADELAFSFERTDTPYSFYDLDSQGGTIHKTTRNESAIVSIIDTPDALNKTACTMDNIGTSGNHSNSYNIKRH